MTADAIVRTVTNAVRIHLRAPGTSALIFAVLGVALAANLVLFSVIDAALFKPLPLPDTRRLVNVYSIHHDGGHSGVSYPDFVDLSAALVAADAAEDVFGYSGLMASLAADARAPQIVFGEIVSANYFRASRAPLILGTGDLGPGDEPGQDARVVLGHAFWQRRFGGDPAVLHRSIRLNGQPFTVVGIAAPEFTGLLFNGLASDVWVPMSQLERVRGRVRSDRAERWVFAKARLREPGDLDAARAIAAVVAARLAGQHPESHRDRSFRLLPSDEVAINPEADATLRPASLAVITLGALLLAIAAANVAGVLLARMALRRRELAVRVSLGATRRQLLIELGAEAAVMAAATLVTGFLLASIALSALQSWQPALPVPLGWTFALGGRAVSFGVAVTALTTALVALLPAWRATRLDPMAGIRGEAGVRTSRGGREALLVPQVALSLVLLIVAGLFTRSLQNAWQISLGFNAADSAAMSLNLGLSGYDEPRARQFWNALVERLRADVGVRAAAIADRIPMDLYGSQSAVVRRPGDQEGRTMQRASVGDGYFDALGIATVAGRVFEPIDREAARPVAVVSQSAAQQLWPSTLAVGQQLQVGGDAAWSTVIGVVDDVQLIETLGENGAPLVYTPLSGGHTRVLRVVAAARAGTPDLESRMLAAARAVDPDVAIFETRRLDDHLATTLLPFRAAAWLALAAGAFGLLLTVAGVAGSVLQAVAARSREMAIRLALGGSHAHVARAVSRPAARATAIGLAAGWMAGFGAAHALGGLLFGIAPLDPLTLALVPAVVVITLLLASALPIRRALGLEPAAVLRDH